jgi:DNA (cytosine-5)-methyltransferase 1
LSRRRKILVADLLCGAGGSSTGCERALLELGVPQDQIELVCVNHWPTAIETHRLNHPKARHCVQDIATVRPHLLVPEGYLDLLMASPTCTHHSIARGGKPTSDQQRSDPWHIITWLTELRVKRIIIENVWEFISWGPVDRRTGKPIASRKGEYFWAWINALKALGFKVEWKKLNAADYGDATTRQRFILMGRSDGKPIQWPMPTHTRRPEEGLALFPTMRPWKGAREIIDWNIKGKSILNRPKPLAAKTLARIYAGAVKFRWPEPYLVILRQHMAAQGLDVPLPTLTAGGTHIGLAQPVVVRTAMHGRKSPGARGAEDPLMTITTDGGIGFAEPLEPQPVLVNMKKGAAPRSTEDALPAQTAEASHLAIAEPIVLSQHNSGAARSTDEPLPTITTGGAGTEDHPGCARPMLVEPFVLSQASGGAPRAVANPLPTIVTGGDRGSGTALIAPYYGSGSGETCTSADEALPTVTTKGRLGVVVPVTNGSGGPGPRSTEEPLPTMTTAKGGEFAFVMPVTHHGGSDRTRDVGEPLPTVTGANRGELAFITAQHGERPGQAPRVHSIDDPTPTVAATGHVDLVEGVEGYDILFRMLEPHELAAAMGFTSEDQAYEFAGTKTDKIKQIGNAVSVAKMKACVGAIMADAAPKRGVAPDDEARREVAA